MTINLASSNINRRINVLKKSAIQSPMLTTVIEYPVLALIHLVSQTSSLSEWYGETQLVINLYVRPDYHIENHSE
jgi:hypothetical protein